MTYLFIMLSLDKDLQCKKNSLAEFESITCRVLLYLPNVLSGAKEKAGYILYYSESAGTKKYVRPINKGLFIIDPLQFKSKMLSFRKILERIRHDEKKYSNSDKDLIDSILYTVQQAIGAGFDLLADPNSARKHVGNRFEELIKAVFSEINVPNKKVVIKIPYQTEEGEKNYTCENDLILSPYIEFSTNNESAPIILETNLTISSPENEITLSPLAEVSVEKYITSAEIVVSVKTTSKDRMGKMFMDKILLERFVGHKLKVIGIFLNDVQRKGFDNISYTLVSGLFMVYNQFITELDGVYYLDPPPNADKEPYNKYIGKFSKLITEDIRALLLS